jgi:hypothetical protein
MCTLQTCCIVTALSPESSELAVGNWHNEYSAFKFTKTRKMGKWDSENRGYVSLDKDLHPEI